MNMKLYTHRLDTQSENLQTLINTVITEQQTTGDYLQLDYDTRQRSRFKATAENGNSVGIDLERTQTIKQGDLLATDRGLELIQQSSDDPSHFNQQRQGEVIQGETIQGEVIQVVAKPQTLTKVSTEDSFLLMRAAYHLGNRHVPLMVTPEALYFEPDHVLSEMLVGLGVTVAEVQAGFEPESGAYSGSGGHSHTHSHGHSHSHSHGHSHSNPLQQADDFHPQDLITANMQFMG